MEEYDEPQTINTAGRVRYHAGYDRECMAADAASCGKPAKSTFYTQTNLVSSMKSLKAKIIDKKLLNPWGLVQGPTPFWISDNNAGVSTLYDGNGKIFKVVREKAGAFRRHDSATCEQHQHCGPLRHCFQWYDYRFWRRPIYLPPRMGLFRDGSRPMGPTRYFTWITLDTHGGNRRRVQGPRHRHCGREPIHLRNEFPFRQRRCLR